LEQAIDQLLIEVRLKLASIDGVLDRLRSRIDIDARLAEDTVRVRLATVRIAIERDRAKLVAANALMSEWIGARTTTTSDAVAAWKAKREVAKLQSRADQAERNAAAARHVALAALDDAEGAALEAWLARHDVNSAIRRA
jgi:hypothetical protein